MLTKVCIVCGVDKSLDQFTSRKGVPDGHCNMCKKCRSFNRNKDRHWDGELLICLTCGESKPLVDFDDNANNEHRKGKDRRCKTCKKEQYERRRIANRGDQGIERLSVERYCGLRDRAKKHGLELDFDVEYLRELWIKQEGKCAISGIQMTTTMFAGRTPTNMSVDRIDSDKGYIKGNVQLVCMAVNQMKSDLTLEELIHFCREILANYKG